MCQTTHGGANNWAVSNYAMNFLVFGNPAGGNPFGTARIPATIQDGTSNTILFAEIYGTCGTSGNMANLYGSLWADANNVWRPGFCAGVSKNGVLGDPACGMFQVQPLPYTGCDAWRASSPHSGGINVCLGDGSIRFLSATMVATTWAAACDPRDGATLGSNW